MGLSGGSNRNFEEIAQYRIFLMSVFLIKYCSAGRGGFGIYGRKRNVCRVLWRNLDKIHHQENLGTDGRIILKATFFLTLEVKNWWSYTFAPPCLLACTGTTLLLAHDFSVYCILHGAGGLHEIWLPFTSRLKL